MPVCRGCLDLHTCLGIAVLGWSDHGLRDIEGPLRPKPNGTGVPKRWGRCIQYLVVGRRSHRNVLVASALVVQAQTKKRDAAYALFFHRRLGDKARKSNYALDPLPHPILEQMWCVGQYQHHLGQARADHQVTMHRKDLDKNWAELQVVKLTNPQIPTLLSGSQRRFLASRPVATSRKGQICRVNVIQ